MQFYKLEVMSKLALVVSILKLPRYDLDTGDGRRMVPYHYCSEDETRLKDVSV